MVQLPFLDDSEIEVLQGMRTAYAVKTTVKLRLRFEIASYKYRQRLYTALNHTIQYYISERRADRDSCKTTPVLCQTRTRERSKLGSDKLNPVSGILAKPDVPTSVLTPHFLLNGTSC